MPHSETQQFAHIRRAQQPLQVQVLQLRSRPSVSRMPAAADARITNAYRPVRGASCEYAERQSHNRGAPDRQCAGDRGPAADVERVGHSQCHVQFPASG